MWRDSLSIFVCFSHHNSYSSEVYFTNGSIQDQLEWLTNDLKEANKPENRAKRPWIIAFGHRPMYCSNIDRDDCATLKSVVRHRWGVNSFFFLDGTEPFLLNVVSIVKTSNLFWQCFVLNLSPDLKLRYRRLSRCLLPNWEHYVISCQIKSCKL